MLAFALARAGVRGRAAADLEPACRRLGLQLTTFPWQPGMRRAGLAQGALYLLRPDGHVAIADPSAGASALERGLGALRHLVDPRPIAPIA